MSNAYSTFVGPPGEGPIALPVSPLSTEQYLRMIDAGILDDDKVELIGGLITPMAPVGPDHNGSLFALTRFLAKSLDRFELAVQATIVVSEGHVFEPDLALVRLRPEGYWSDLPKAEDLALVVESSASSLKKDRYVKLPVYAAAGIQEYWIANIERRTLSVFRNPQGAAYSSEQTLAGEDLIAPLACPEMVIRVGSIFG